MIATGVGLCSPECVEGEFFPSPGVGSCITSAALPILPDRGIVLGRGPAASLVGCLLENSALGFKEGAIKPRAEPSL